MCSVNKKSFLCFLVTFLVVFTLVFSGFSCNGVAYAVSSTSQAFQDSVPQTQTKENNKADNDQIQTVEQSQTPQSDVSSNKDITINAENIRNTTKAKISVTPFSSDSFTTCKVVGSMQYSYYETRHIEYTIPFNDFTNTNNTGTYEIDLKDFGRFSLNIQLLDRSFAEVASYNSDSFGVTADTYNIVSLTATMPVNISVLELWGQDSYRHDGPVIIELDRRASIDWSNLPSADDTAIGGYLYGTYSLPYLTTDELTECKSYSSEITKVRLYIASLMGLDSSSKIHLFCNNDYSPIINSLIYANNVANYKVTMLTDGDSTPIRIKSTFSSAFYNTNLSINDQFIKTWDKNKAKAISTHCPASITRNIFDTDFFFPALCADENIELIVTKKSAITTPKDGDEFGAYIRNYPRVKEVNLSNLLKNNIMTSEKATSELKKLYRFNDNVFEKAKEEGKQVMMIIGAASIKDDIKAYTNILKAYYGTDDYCYYFKGHPNGTENPSEKSQILAELGIDSVDSNIPAELVIFFNNDIKLAGYTSSVFQNLPYGMDKAMFRTDKATCFDYWGFESYKGCDFWSNEVKDNSADNIKSLCDMSHRNFLLELSDAVTQETGNSIAIWDDTEGTMTYYKLENGAYVPAANEGE